MTKDEMQRFLNHEAEIGRSKQEALEALAEVLGIVYPETDSEENENQR